MNVIGVVPEFPSSWLWSLMRSVESSSTIVVVFDPVSIAAYCGNDCKPGASPIEFGLERFSEYVSFVSSTESGLIETATGIDVTPGGNVNMPLVAV